jgi:hypothetical protein
MEHDKRLYPRSKVRWPVTMISSAGSMQGETRDMSTLGAFISCETPLHPTERLLLNVKLPSGSPLQVSAQVVWSQVSTPGDEMKPCGIGVRFIW